MNRKGRGGCRCRGGSLQITLFQKGKAITTQHLLLGTMRIYEKLSEIGNAVIYYDDLIKELVDKELDVFKDIYLKDNRLPVPDHDGRLQYGDCAQARKESGPHDRRRGEIRKILK